MAGDTIRRLVASGDIDATDTPNISLFATTFVTPGVVDTVSGNKLNFSLDTGARVVFLQDVGALPDIAVADYSVKLYRSTGERTNDLNAFFDSGSITSSAGSPTQYNSVPSIFVDLGVSNTIMYGQVSVVGIETPQMTMTSQEVRFTLV